MTTRFFFQVAHRAAANVGLGDLVHFDGGHDAAEEPSLFNGVLQRDGIDDGRKHAHVVGGDAVHVDGLLGDAAEEVATADDDRDLATQGVHVGDLGGDLVDEDRVDAKAAPGRQGFA